MIIKIYKNISLWLQIWIIIFSFFIFKIEGQFLFYTERFSNPYNLTNWAEELSKKEVQRPDVVFQELILNIEESNITVPILFFDRKSDKVIVAGQGLWGSKEDMITFARLFPEYDVICFDYRWASDSYFFINASTLMSPIKSVLFDEQQEILIIGNFLKNRKKYKDIIGLGLCYSASLFLITQVNNNNNNNGNCKSGEKIFTKLILDSVWLSLKDFVANISLDPCLPFNPQIGGCPNIIKNILKAQIIQFPLVNFLQWITPDYSLDTYLSRITDTPILFIHGLEDLLVPINTFKDIWYLTRNTQKAAFMTPNRHSDNSKNRLVYKTMCSEFIELEFDLFIESIIKLQD